MRIHAFYNGLFTLSDIQSINLKSGLALARIILCYAGRATQSG